MLNELVKRFSGRPAERRLGARVRKRYPIAWIRGTELVPAAGLEIGETGLLFATRTAPSGPHVDVVVDLDKRRIRVRLTVARTGPIERDGVAWTRSPE